MQTVKMERLLQILIAVLLVGFAYVVYDSIRDRVVVVGDTAPNFSVTTDSGRTVTRADFGGKLLVLNFWATWCPPCVDEVASLNEFQKQLASSGVVVLGVSVDGNQKAYRDFVRKNGIVFLTARDPQANLPSSYGTYKYPESYLIDRRGRVVQKIIGETNWTDANMIANVKSLLSREAM